MLILLILVFLAYSFFIATHLQQGIVPDEPAHLVFSKHYATTWGIPDDTLETYSKGWYIQHNPFLYYWINGRFINLFQTVYPAISDWQLLVALRLISSFYSLGTIIFCYFLSKELISGKWWQLLPVFLLTNTLMFVFLSGGVNYDNLANLLSMSGLYYFIKALKKINFVSNSLLSLFLISLGTLVKFTILPLALVMVIIGIVFFIIHRKDLTFLKYEWKKTWFLAILLVAALIGNFLIYGENILKFGKMLPACPEILSQDKCDISPFVKRYQEIGLDHKLSVIESIELGYPNPVKYFFDSWIDHMLTRVFGILGHKSHFPSHIVIFFKLLLFWIILMGFRNIEKPPFEITSMIIIILFYSFVLFLNNYASELTYGFKQIALQGRYIFPVIGLIYVLVSYIVSVIKSKPIKYVTLAIVLILFFLGGPFKFISKFDLIFYNWFI